MSIRPLCDMILTATRTIYENTGKQPREITLGNRLFDMVAKELEADYPYPSKAYFKGYSINGMPILVSNLTLGDIGMMIT